MAKGKSTPPPSRSMPKLTVSRQEAQSRIEEQIKKSDGIKALKIGSEADLKAARQEYYKWHDFNRDLLRRLFDTEEVSDAYSSWIGIAIGGRPTPLHQQIRDHLNDVDEKIHRLESVKEKLSLYDEPKQVAPEKAVASLAAPVPKPRRIFISHGRSDLWRQVQAYIEKDIKIPTLELAQEANRGRTVLQKLWDESGKCSFVVIVMTGDDQGPDGKPRARENVMHEIGFFQGRFGLENVCILYEEETNIPSNIHGLVYIPFNKGNIREVFGELFREIRSAFTL